MTDRFIPAYAGNSPAENGSPRRDSVHPRLRGELRIVKCPEHGYYGSSPLTRGTLNNRGALMDVDRFIPAYAGNSYS